LSGARWACYLDLDGTLLGRAGSLLHDGEGHVSLLGARAIEACLRADVEVVLMSGRRRANVAEIARLFGQSAFIFEAGTVLSLDGEDHWLTGEFVPNATTVYEQIAASGAPDLLLEAYPGRLEYHEPWAAGRDVSHLFRGLIDAGEADALLARHGHDRLRLVDNGAVNRRSPALDALPYLRGYHLIPAGGSKAAAVALHMQVRGLDHASTFAVGDSREDLAVAQAVGTFWLVANAFAVDASLTEALRAFPNVRVAQDAHGAGVYEAVMTTLAERR
jgi:hydroxymethylpyrimidine pyrophosphatase-like HAD family hydrolase